MVKLQPITNVQYEQALKTERWMKELPDKVVKARNYIMENNITVYINLIHDEIVLSYDPELTEVHLIKLTNILK